MEDNKEKKDGDKNSPEKESFAFFWEKAKEVIEMMSDKTISTESITAFAPHAKEFFTTLYEYFKAECISSAKSHDATIAGLVSSAETLVQNLSSFPTEEERNRVLELIREIKNDIVSLQREQEKHSQLNKRLLIGCAAFISVISLGLFGVRRNKGIPSTSVK